MVGCIVLFLTTIEIMIFLGVDGLEVTNDILILRIIILFKRISRRL